MQHVCTIHQLMWVGLGWFLQICWVGNFLTRKGCIRLKKENLQQLCGLILNNKVMSVTNLYKINNNLHANNYEKYYY